LSSPKIKFFVAAAAQICYTVLQWNHHAVGGHMSQVLRVLGIDPGYAIVGWGVLDYDGYRFSPVEHGAVLTDAGLAFERRLEVIWDELSAVVERLRPSAMAVERLYFTTNQKTAIAVAEARGVILLCGVKHDISVFEYTPLQVKQSVVGYGKAEKNQVMQMVKTLLKLDKVPKPDDTADALAIAICHAHTHSSWKIENRK
jgi:crossover junction endodeoxyribonuclease RuvC